MPLTKGPCFAESTKADITLWRCKPDRSTTLEFLLGEIKKSPGGAFIKGGKLDARRQGNLGEFIALRVALGHPFNKSTPQVFASNAIAPLQPISSAGIDICYAIFDPSTPAKDVLWIQETKTTCAKDLSYAHNLTDDYRKLFGTDLNLTLQSRIQVMQNRLELERNLPTLSKRLGALAATTASSCTQIRLMPTLVHDEASDDPVPTLVAVRSAICSLGWNKVQLSAWSIAIHQLEAALTGLAKGTVQ